MEDQKFNKEMPLKRSLTLGEAITTFIVLVGTIISFYVSVQVRLSQMELRQNTYENTVNKMDAQFNKVNDKLDNIQSIIGDMKVQIATKKDK